MGCEKCELNEQMMWDTERQNTALGAMNSRLRRELAEQKEWVRDLAELTEKAEAQLADVRSSLKEANGLLNRVESVARHPMERWAPVGALIDSLFAITANRREVE